MSQEYTKSVITSMGPKTAPRSRQVLGSLIQHIHDFSRENAITIDEWMSAVEFVNRIGQISDDKRNEGILVSDVLGLESLVDAMAYSSEDASGKSTDSAILGPFYRENSPAYSNGSSIIIKDVGGDVSLIEGTVTDTSGAPLVGAKVEVWHTAPNGLYEQQDPEQPEYNLRGTFTTDSNGYYAYVGLRPTSYPIPYDGPAGLLLQLMDRHPMRPSHIHYKVSKPGYRTLITQIFDSRDEYCKDDSVFAVKTNLIVDFKPATEKAKQKNANYELVYNISLLSDAEHEAQVSRRNARLASGKPK